MPEFDLFKTFFSFSDSLHHQNEGDGFLSKRKGTEPDISGTTRIWITDKLLSHWMTQNQTGSVFGQLTLVRFVDIYLAQNLNYSRLLYIFFCQNGSIYLWPRTEPNWLAFGFWPSSVFRCSDFGHPLYIFVRWCHFCLFGGG